MHRSSTADAAPGPPRLLRPDVILLLGVGLLGHLYAAHAVGGSLEAYTHHVLGFLLILAVTGGILAGLGWRFWPARTTRTLLAIGVVQAVVGLWIAAEPLRAAGGP